MNIIALGSTGTVATVAITSGGRVVAEYSTDFKKTHSETLLPMLDEIKRRSDYDISSVDAVAVSSGPGSFTGLRIGAATAKGLSLAIDCPIIPVPTCEGLAYNMYGSPRLVVPIVDARRDQVYTGIYEFRDAGEKGFVMETAYGQAAMDIRGLLEILDKREDVLSGRAAVFLGDGIRIYKDIINKEMKGAHTFAPEFMAKERAAVIAMLAERYYELGRYVSGDDFAPEYLRKSQAERVRDEKAAK